MPRRPPHFKLYASAQNHRKLPGLWEDDALLAMYVRAGVLLIERFAAQTGNRALVGRRDLMRVANTEPWVNAQRKLRRLVAATPLRIRCECAGGPLEGRCPCAALSLELPNLLKKQGFRPENGAGMEGKRVSPSSSASSSNPSGSPLNGSRKVRARRAARGARADDAAASAAPEDRQLSQDEISQAIAELADRSGKRMPTQ